MVYGLGSFLTLNSKVTKTVHAFDPSLPEAEAEGSLEFEATVVHIMRHFLKSIHIHAQTNMHTYIYTLPHRDKHKQHTLIFTHTDIHIYTYTHTYRDKHTMICTWKENNRKGICKLYDKQSLGNPKSPLCLHLDLGVWSESLLNLSQLLSPLSGFVL